MPTLAITQARLESTRLPGKVLLKIGEETLLSYQIKRLKLSSKIDKIIVATSIKPSNNAIETECHRLNIDCFRGSEDDVLDRYYKCSLVYPEYNQIIRLTADCPLVDPKVIDNMILFFENNHLDYTWNVGHNQNSFPDGLDADIFTKNALAIAAKKAVTQFDHEHVTSFIRNSSHFKRLPFPAPKNFLHIRLTVDYPEDFELIKYIIANSSIDASYEHYLNLLASNPAIANLNKHITFNSKTGPNNPKNI